MVNEYKVISGFRGVDELTKLVNEAIKEGWQPLGGIVYVPTDNYFSKEFNKDEPTDIVTQSFAATQAMVR